MKISVKFFCIAYIIVLLSTGLSGIFLISNSRSKLIDLKTAQVDSAAKYACESIYSFAETSIGEITGSQLSNMAGQIKSNFGNEISKISVLPKSSGSGEYLKLKANEAFTGIVKAGGVPAIEAVCRVKINNEAFFVVVNSNLSDIENHFGYLWAVYGIAVFFFAVTSGLLLYLSARKITKPIYTLSKAANDIANGGYGTTIAAKGRDSEIIELTNSFNTMSVTVKEKINEIEEELEKRDTFVSNFTHELKTPMTSIIGYSQMLNSYALEENEKRQAAESIHSEAARLEKLAMQLLELYIYKNEKVKLEKISLRDIAKALESTLKISAQKQSVKLSVSLRGIVFANKELILSMLYNLSDNAMKASEKDGEIEIFSRDFGGKVRIYVKDSGRGISPENIKRLTEPFYREDKSRSRTLGSAGLGLSLCQKIAEIHNTALNFESVLNKGTTVTFELMSGGEE